MPPQKQKLYSQYLRNFTFGVEDSIASTVGLLSGVASANVSQATIVVTGLILVLTEAMSMGVGSFLSEESAEEYIHHQDAQGRDIISALIMFLSYAFAGIIPIAPYIFFSMPVAMWLSIVFSFAGLLGLGFINAKISHTSVVRQGRRMLILGGSVAIVGLVIGSFLKKFTG